MALADRALPLKAKWLDLILAGDKALDIRGTNHHLAGQMVYLLETKTGRVRGSARLGASRPLTQAERVEHQAGLAEMGYEKPTAWPLTEVSPVDPEWTISKAARSKCPTWVLRRRWEQFPVEVGQPAHVAEDSMPVVPSEEGVGTPDDTEPGIFGEQETSAGTEVRKRRAAQIESVSTGTAAASRVSVPCNQRADAFCAPPLRATYLTEAQRAALGRRLHMPRLLHPGEVDRDELPPVESGTYI
jgi:hypothetical protein